MGVREASALETTDREEGQGSNLAGVVVIDCP